MRTLQLFILFSISVLSFTTCKKYPQDGKLSFETPDKRLRRVWTLTECLVDGNDVTDTEYNYFTSSIYSLRNATLEFMTYRLRVNGKMEKQYGSNLLINYKNNSTSARIHTSSSYKFNSNKSEITFNTNNYLPNDFPLLFNYTNEPWTIKELIKTKLIIETTNSNGNKIKVTFKGQ